MRTHGPTLDELQRTLGAWSDRVHGPGIQHAPGLIRHLAEEIGELGFEWTKGGVVARSPIREECADIAILLLVLCHRLGFRLDDAIAAKHGVNVARRWLPPDEHGVIRHDPADDP